MDIEHIGRRAAAHLHDQAAAVADTDAQLDAVLRSRGGTQPLIQSGSRRGARRWSRTQWAVAAGAVAAGIAVVAVSVIDTDDDRQLTPATAPVTLPDSAVPSTTTAPTATSVPGSTSAPSTTSDYAPPTGGPQVLRHGLAIPSAIDEVPLVLVRTVDALFDDARATSITELTYAWEAADVTILVELSDTSNARWIPGPWARQLGPGAWVTATLYPPMPEGDIDPGLADVLERIVNEASYNSQDDNRVASRSTTMPAPAECDSADWSFGGAPGLADMVLLTCDGTLARYDGETGQQLEVISEFGDQSDPEVRMPVDDVTVSADGTAVLYQFGDEPVSGNSSRYVFGSGDPEELRMVGPGTSSAVSTTGDLTATTALQYVEVRSGESPVAVFELYSYAPFRDMAFAPDNSQIALDIGGVIALVDLNTGDVELLANDDPSVRYAQPSFEGDSLRALVVFADGSVGSGVIGEGGELIEVTGPDDWDVPFRKVLNAPLVLRGTSLGYGEGEGAIGTGILLAEGIPGT